MPGAHVSAFQSFSALASAKAVFVILIFYVRCEFDPRSGKSMTGPVLVGEETE